MSREWSVSVPTVLRAYRLLEARRLVEGRAKSGFYVLPSSVGRLGPADREAPVPDPSAIRTSDLIMRFLEMVSDPDLIPLGTALPDPDFLPTATLARFLGRTARRHALRSAAISPPSGIPELRHEVARRALHAGCSVAADDVVITCGCTEAIALCLRSLTDPGDTVAVESPTYFGTLQVLDALGLKALEIPVDPDIGISLEHLDDALSRGGVSAVVVTPNVQNPLGCVMPDERKRELVRILEAHGVPAIEDETYAELHYARSRPCSLQALDRAGLILSCGSFSKTLAPGYRIGWAIPGRFRDAVLHFKLATTVGTPVPPQFAFAEFLSSGEYDPHLRRVRQIFESNVHRLTYEIGNRLPHGTLVSRPAGGFLLWTRLPYGTDALGLQHRAIARGLSVAPGPAFSASGRFRDYVRINAGYRWSAGMEKALDGLAELIKEDNGG
jgi:DNA-binding transcriptional MocR family regulator